MKTGRALNQKILFQYMIRYGIVVLIIACLMWGLMNWILRQYRESLMLNTREELLESLWDLDVFFETQQNVRGLGVAAGHRIFVTDLITERNEVVLGEHEELFSTELHCNKLNWMAIQGIDGPIKCIGKIRYAHKGTSCMIESAGEDMVKVTFTEPVRAITPGQAVVFYKEDYVLGGGTIL